MPMAADIPDGDVVEAAPTVYSRLEVFFLRAFLLSLALGSISAMVYCGWFLLLETASLLSGVVVASEEVFFWSCCVFALGLPSGLSTLMLLAGHDSELDLSAQQARNPDQPWLWQEHWKCGVVSDSRPLGLFWILIFFIVCFTPAVWATLPAMFNPVAAVAWPQYVLLPLFFCIAVVVFFKTARYLKYGNPSLQISSVPMTDGKLCGYIDLKFVPEPDAKVFATLNCEEIFDSKDSEQDGFQYTQMHEEQKQFSVCDSEVPGHSRLAFKFDIPASAPQSAREPRQDAQPWTDYVWTVQVKMKRLGLDYVGWFRDVPVFREGVERSKPEVRDHRDRHFLEERSPSETFRSAGVKYEERAGEVSLIVPMFHRIWATVFFFLVALLCGVIAAYLNLNGPPQLWILLGVAGVAGVVAFLISIQAATYSAQLCIDDDKITGKNGWPRRREILDVPLGAIAGVYSRGYKLGDSSDGVWCKLKTGSRFQVVRHIGLSADQTLIAIIRRKLQKQNDNRQRS